MNVRSLCRGPVTLLVPAWISACLDTGLDQVQVPLNLAGTALDAPFSVRDDWQVELEQAQLAFGPLRLCAGQRASGLCDTARAEWLDSAVVDLVSGTPMPVGELSGSSGVVRSSMYDLGIVSLLTRSEPVLLTAAEALGGQSLRLVGRASQSDVSLLFSVAMRIEQGEDVERGAPVIRLASTPDQVHDLGQPGSSLTVRFDPRPLLSNVDFTGLMQSTACQPTCPAPIEFVEGSQPYRAVRNDIQAGPRPVFEWRVDDP